MNDNKSDFSGVKAKKYNIEGSTRCETLLEHSLAVADEARRQASLCLKADSIYTPYIKDMAWLCGFFHDIGKCTQGFQNHLLGTEQKPKSGKGRKKNTQDASYDHIHNITGAVLFHNLVRVTASNEYCYFINNGQIVTRSILHHHPIPYVNRGKNEPFVVKWSDRYGDLVRYMVEVANQHLDHVKVEYVDPRKDPVKGIEKGVDTLQLASENIPKYYSTDPNSYNNPFNFIFDQVVKMSDVIMSMHLDNPLAYFNTLHYRSNEIRPSDIIRPEGYDERYELQCEYAERLADHSISLFGASTGFGKTSVGLHYVLSQKNEGRKAFWVCPRNTIARSIYDTLTKEIDARGLSEKVSVALLLTNDWKEGDEKADIIVTNIDNFLRPALKNDVIKRTLGMLSSVCIFDEYHEYVGGGSSLMAMFDVVLRSRELTNSKTLLLSATPATLFESIGGSHSQVYREEHTDAKIANRIYNLSYDAAQITKGLKNTLYQVYSRQTAQSISKADYTDDIFHSCFLPSHKEEKFNRILAIHGKESKDKSTSYVTTNIISTGVDVDFKDLIINLPSPDSLIQSLGRCNRWCDGSEDHGLIVLGEDMSKSETQTISSMFGSTKIHVAFYKYLKDNLLAGRHTFEEICNIRQGFYATHKKLYTEYFFEALSQSYCRLADFKYDYIPETDTRDGEHFVGNNILRSDGVSEGFYCYLYGKNGTVFPEPFCGDTLLINLLKRNREELKEIWDYHEKKAESTFSKGEETMAKSKGYEELIRCFIKKAHSDKHPFHISNRYYRYDEKLGLVKIINRE